jgi:hypothetical protein
MAGDFGALVGLASTRPGATILLHAWPHKTLRDRVDFVAQFRTDIKHISGQDNVVADALSRVTGGTQIDSILAEFPDLTRPAGVQCEVRHNTVHHIRATPGPPVTYRPRRLAPDRIATAKAEFDTMLQDGTARRSESSSSSALHIVL